MKIQRKFFFDVARAKLFDGALTQSQVEGMTAILNYAEKSNIDDRHVAYILATTFHETGREMIPISEWGKGAGHSYGTPDPATGQTYYGRGFVQITWKENYQKQDDKLKLGGKLVKNADLALDMDIALKILFGGMEDGDFTGKCLDDYITCEDHETDTTDFYSSRKIVNALDQASTIADYANRFVATIAHAKRGG
jgi:putative chitinase